MVEYNEGDLVLCEVTDIVKTTVFVKTLEGLNGSIVFSEIAPGRIRNIREYVVPKKIIVCKILSIRDNHLFLSLRRVKTDERKDMLNDYKRGLTFKSIIKKITGEDSEEIINRIKKDTSLIKLVDNAKEDKKVLEKYFNAKQIEELSKVLQSKKEKQKELKKEFLLSCTEPDGITRIKRILSIYPEITYLGSSKFQIKVKSNELKKAGSEISNILEEIEKKAKKEKCEFSVKK
ncbi:MAG: hypothetical protein WC533_04460 [Candidatus Pacearchaeota archaeon]